MYKTANTGEIIGKLEIAKETIRTLTNKLEMSVEETANEKSKIENLKVQLKVQIQCGKDMRYIIKGLEEELTESKRLISIQKQALLDVSPVKRRLEKEKNEAA